MDGFNDESFRSVGEIVAALVERLSHTPRLGEGVVISMEQWRRDHPRTARARKLPLSGIPLATDAAVVANAGE